MVGCLFRVRDTSGIGAGIDLQVISLDEQRSMKSQTHRSEQGLMSETA
jgi:hypothetical protein